MKTLFLSLLLIPAGFSQYPGQGPPGTYPPGTYPPGTYPPGQQGPGIPFPRRGKTTSREQKSEEYQIIRGVIRSIDAKSMEVDASDEREVTVQINDKTKKPDKLAPGDKVEIDATQDDKGAFTAAVIKKTGSTATQTTTSGQAPGAQTSAKNSAPENAEDNGPTTTMATPLSLDPDEGAPPKLKRGIPKSKKPEASSTTMARNEPPPASRPSSLPVTGPASAPVRETAPAPAHSAEPDRSAPIEKAKEAAQNFLASLPNYIVQQFTTRYVSSGRVTNWQAQDIVSADVVYEKGKERYEHVAINGKQTKKSVEETGAWSYGEFGTVLNDLFSPATAAKFKYAGSRSINRQPAFVYDFDVDHQHSHWQISVPGQKIYPAYHGSVWIAKDTARVLRIEMQAVKIPVEFPEDTTELALDYDYITLPPEKYLLPAKAEVLSCQRGANICDRNVIEFRNYHRYAGESTITFH